MSLPLSWSCPSACPPLPCPIVLALSSLCVSWLIRLVLSARGNQAQHCFRLHFRLSLFEPFFFTCQETGTQHFPHFSAFPLSCCLAALRFYPLKGLPFLFWEDSKPVICSASFTLLSIRFNCYCLWVPLCVCTWPGSLSCCFLQLLFYPLTHSSSSSSSSS